MKVKTRADNDNTVPLSVGDRDPVTGRLIGECVVCHKIKPTYNHLNGDKNAPLCGNCSMRLWRESTSKEQAKRLKLMATLIGGLDAALAFNLEGHEREFLISTQDSFKRLLRYWAGDESANIKQDVLAGDRAEACKPEHDGEYAPEANPDNPPTPITDRPRRGPGRPRKAEAKDAVAI